MDWKTFAYSVLLLPRLNKKYLYHHPSCFLLFGLAFWKIHSVFCPSVDDGGAGWWQNGQFGKIRFDPWPALQPITIQYPRLTGLPTNLLLILDRDQKGRQNVLIKNGFPLSSIFLDLTPRPFSDVLRRVFKWGQMAPAP